MSAARSVRPARAERACHRHGRRIDRTGQPLGCGRETHGGNQHLPEWFGRGDGWPERYQLRPPGRHAARVVPDQLQLLYRFGVLVPAAAAPAAGSAFTRPDEMDHIVRRGRRQRRQRRGRAQHRQHERRNGNVRRQRYGKRTSDCTVSGHGMLDDRKAQTAGPTRFGAPPRHQQHVEALARDRSGNARRRAASRPFRDASGHDSSRGTADLNKCRKPFV